MNKLYFKSEIFDLFENARELFNDYYNGKEEYTNKDISEINKLIWNIQNNIDEISSMIIIYAFSNNNIESEEN